LDERSLQTAAEFQAGALRFAEMLGPILQNRGLPPGLAYAQALIDRLFRHPTREEAEIIGLFPHSADYAHVHTRTVANVEELSSAGPVVAMYHSWWREGLLAMMTEKDRERILRLDQAHPRVKSALGTLVRYARKKTPSGIQRGIRRLLPDSLAARVQRFF
jgi:hypothetical protein